MTSPTSLKRNNEQASVDAIEPDTKRRAQDTPDVFRTAGSAADETTGAIPDSIAESGSDEDSESESESDSDSDSEDESSEEDDREDKAQQQASVRPTVAEALAANHRTGTYCDAAVCECSDSDSEEAHYCSHHRHENGAEHVDGEAADEEEDEDEDEEEEDEDVEEDEAPRETMAERLRRFLPQLDAANRSLLASGAGAGGFEVQRMGTMGTHEMLGRDDSGRGDEGGHSDQNVWKDGEGGNGEEQEEEVQGPYIEMNLDLGVLEEQRQGEGGVDGNVVDGVRLPRIANHDDNAGGTEEEVEEDVLSQLTGVGGSTHSAATSKRAVIEEIAD